MPTPTAYSALVKTSFSVYEVLHLEEVTESFEIGHQVHQDYEMGKCMNKALSGLAAALGPIMDNQLVSINGQPVTATVAGQSVATKLATCLPAESIPFVVRQFVSVH